MLRTAVRTASSCAWRARAHGTRMCSCSRGRRCGVVGADGLLAGRESHLNPKQHSDLHADLNDFVSGTLRTHGRRTGALNLKLISPSCVG